MTEKSGRGTARQTFRAEPALWEQFGENVTRQGEPDRSDVLRRFIRWYNREPGAKLPRRPPST